MTVKATKLHKEMGCLRLRYGVFNSLSNITVFMPPRLYYPGNVPRRTETP
jgi:hypothetical protein